VGGGTTVRGYLEQRFAGRRSAYTNAELRLLAGRLPFGDLGIFGWWTQGGCGSRGVVGPLARRRGGRAMARVAAPP